MTDQTLIDYTSNKRTNLIDATTLVYNGLEYFISDLLTGQFVEIYAQTERENGAGVRSILLPGSIDPTSITNTDYISLIRTASNAKQKIIDIYNNILGQVMADILTTEAQVDTAWDAATSGYSNNRIWQVTNETLNTTITALGTHGFAYFTPNTNPARLLGTAYQPSAVRGVLVSAAVDISCTLSLVTGQNGTVVFEIADDAGFLQNVKTVCSAGGSNTGTLSAGLNLVQQNTVSLVGMVPSAKYYRFRTVNNIGVPVFTLKTVQEVTC